MEFDAFLFGILTSLIATIIWVILTQLYDFSSKSKIAFLLELLYDCADNFDSAIEFSNCDIAEAQADKIIEYCKEIFNNIRPLTYSRKKRKLIYTILYNVYYTVSYYKRVWVGYDEEREALAKLNKFKKRYYYKISIYSNHDDFIENRNFLTVSIAVLQSINRNFSVKKALTNNLYIDKTNTKLNETYISLIAPSNFKSKYDLKYDIRRNCFTQDQYIKYISGKL